MSDDKNPYRRHMDELDEWLIWETPPKSEEVWMFRLIVAGVIGIIVLLGLI